LITAGFVPPIDRTAPGFILVQPETPNAKNKLHHWGKSIFTPAMYAIRGLAASAS
jgi:hypothetical protein